VLDDACSDPSDEEEYKLEVKEKSK